MEELSVLTSVLNAANALISNPSTVTGRHWSTVVTSDEGLQGANNYCHCGKQKETFTLHSLSSQVTGLR
jgi:hypothetical protein